MEKGVYILKNGLFILKNGLYILKTPVFWNYLYFQIRGHFRDPCSHPQDTTPKEAGSMNAEMRSACSQDPLHASLMRRACRASGALRIHQDRSKDSLRQDNGGRILTATRPVKGSGQDDIQEPVGGT